MTASTGTWTGKTPITFADQWSRCDANGNNCSPISGETGQTRIVDSGDVGKRLKVRVTATNSTSVPADQRLIVDSVKFSPNPVAARNTPIAVSVHVVDTRGYVVRDALVFVRSVPILTSTPPELATAQNGWAIFQVLPRADFPLRNGHSVQFFVRARRTGDNVLAGVGTRRLVQVRTATG